MNETEEGICLRPAGIDLIEPGQTPTASRAQKRLDHSSGNVRRGDPCLDRLPACVQPFR